MPTDPREDVPIRRTVSVEITVGWLIVVVVILMAVFCAGVGYLGWLAIQWLGAL